MLALAAAAFVPGAGVSIVALLVGPARLAPVNRVMLTAIGQPAGIDRAWIPVIWARDWRLAANTYAGCTSCRPKGCRQEAARVSLNACHLSAQVTTAIRVFGARFGDGLPLPQSRYDDEHQKERRGRRQVCRAREPASPGRIRARNHGALYWRQQSDGALSCLHSCRGRLSRLPHSTLIGDSASEKAGGSMPLRSSWGPLPGADRTGAPARRRGSRAAWQPREPRLARTLSRSPRAGSHRRGIHPR
jgi:hypothetical protein